MASLSFSMRSWEPVSSEFACPRISIASSKAACWGSSTGSANSGSPSADVAGESHNTPTAVNDTRRRFDLLIQSSPNIL